MAKKFTAMEVMKLLNRQTFADWYNEGGDFDKRITGDEDAPSDEELLAQLESMLVLASRALPK